MTLRQDRAGEFPPRRGGWTISLPSSSNLEFENRIAANARVARMAYAFRNRAFLNRGGSPARERPAAAGSALGLI